MTTSPIKFGVYIPQDAPYPVIRQLAQAADRLGYHSLWLIDHLIGASVRRDTPLLECWTLMSALAGITSRVRIGTMVLCNAFRSPSLLAKMSATLDVISNGRLEFAIGAGWYAQEFKQYGFPFPPPGTRIRQLEEGIEVIRRMWTEEEATFQGRYYQIDHAINYPKPVQKPHPPIHIGGRGEKLMLRLVARHADIWNVAAGTPPEEYRHKTAVLEQHCREIGRDPDSIERSRQMIVVFSEEKDALPGKMREAQERFALFGDLQQLAIRGTAEECIAQLQRFVALGVTFFVLFLSDVSIHPESQGLVTLQRFAERVLPAFA
ncbi:MAG: LLM class F420-dependent oxidoreductase [Nitrospinota bacterium]|nr:MAG: LLM class F420-dependent oxidoreductase [Nitrospinota bacterium]